jgi:hypothetical protein
MDVFHLPKITGDRILSSSNVVGSESTFVTISSAFPRDERKIAKKMGKTKSRNIIQTALSGSAYNTRADDFK